MAIGFLPIALGGGVIGAIRQRKQKRRQLAAKNAFSNKYPLVDDVSAMESSIANAEKELVAMKAAPTKNAAQRRAKAITVSTLQNWILSMKEDLRDLKAELSVASAQTQVQQTSSTTRAVSNAQSLPIETPSQAPVVAGQTMEVTENLAAPTVKKGVNWLLIVGVALGGIFLYKTLKK